MKRFLKSIVVFLVPLLLLGYLFDIVISTNLKKSNLYAEKEFPTWNAIINGKVDSDIVIYGSSRAWVHINPTMIGTGLNTSVYNLGIDGHGFRLQNVRHKMLLKYNRKPKLIIHSVDIFTLAKDESYYNYDQFLPYMLYNDDIENATDNYSGFTLSDYKLPLLRYYGKPRAIRIAFEIVTKPENNTIQRIRGYKGQERVWNADFDKTKASMKSYKVTLDPEVIRLFDNYLKECKANDIRIILVYTPEFIEGQKFIENRKEIIAIYTQLSKKYNIPFYDFSNDPLSSDKKYFYNALHLNKTGAELFTKELIALLSANGY